MYEACEVCGEEICVCDELDFEEDDEYFEDIEQAVEEDEEYEDDEDF